MVESVVPSEPDPSPGPAPRRFGSLLDWFFRNRHTGRITIAQFPNVPLWIFVAAALLRWIIPSGSWAHTLAAWVAAVALAWWAGDEILRGVNP